MSDKQGTGFGLSRYWFDLSAASASFAGSYAEMLVPQGNVAAGAADSGNPVKVGGKYNLTQPTLADGQRGDLQEDARGNLRVTVMSGSNNASVAALGGDGNGSPTALQVYAYGVVFNGTTWDRVRGNIDQTVGITAVGVTTTQTGADQVNYNGRGAKVVLDMTNVGTGSVTITIQGKDVASGKYYTLLAGAAVTTNSTNVYEVYPGIPAAANAAASATLPRTWRVLVTANNANATTYTVGASVIL